MSKKDQIRHLPVRRALERFQTLALKNGWRIPKTRMEVLLKARENIGEVDAQGKHLDRLTFFSCVQVPRRGNLLKGTKNPVSKVSLKIVDVDGSFARECEVAYHYFLHVEGPWTPGGSEVVSKEVLSPAKTLENFDEFK